MPSDRPTQRLRALLQRDQALMAAGAFSPMPARLAEHAGFEAVYMPGGGTALDRLGYQLMILPNFTALAAIKAMADVLADIRETGSVAAVLDRCATFKEFTALGGLAAFQDVERRFAVPSQAAT